MARSFHDGLAKGLGIGVTIVGFMMMVMFSLLPLGIFSKTLDLEHYLKLKTVLSIIFALITLKFYINYAKRLDLSPIAFGFGVMISLIMSGVLFFTTVDVILKLIGLE